LAAQPSDGKTLRFTCKPALTCVKGISTMRGRNGYIPGRRELMAAKLAGSALQVLDRVTDPGP
jgi:hypothetical protein